MNNTYPDIAVVLYNDLNPNCDDIAQNLIDLTDFKLRGKYNLNVFYTTTITTTLKDLAAHGFTWAVVVTAGNFLQDQNLLFQTIDHAKSENSPLACHILDKGGYYHFHQQWFAINLVDYTKIGSPTFEITSEPIELTTQKTERCPDNVHDEYTPWWLRPSDKQLITYTSDRGYFGITVISEFIRNGYNITNIPTEVRNRKNYCYPKFNYDGIVKLINDPEYIPEDHTSPLWWFKHTMDNLTKNLKVGYYVLNTEHLITNEIIKSTDLDCFIGVCGGLKPACIAGQPNFVSNSKIYLFDISHAALEWQKYLINNWSGEFDSFELVFADFKKQYPTYVPIYFTHDTIDNNLTWFLSNAGMTREEFTVLWQRYRNMEHYYVNLNLLNDDAADQILKLVATATQGAYVWVSNAFIMDYLMFYRTRAGSETLSKNFTNELKFKTTLPLFLENCGRLDFFQPM